MQIIKIATVLKLEENSLRVEGEAIILNSYQKCRNINRSTGKNKGIQRERVWKIFLYF